MTTAAVIAYPAGGDPLDSAPIRVLERVSGVEIEVESLVPLGEMAPVYFWGRGDRLGALERALEEDPTVDGLPTGDDPGGTRRPVGDLPDGRQQPPQTGDGVSGRAVAGRVTSGRAVWW